jgi:hypothetical protein
MSTTATPTDSSAMRKAINELAVQMRRVCGRMEQYDLSNRPDIAVLVALSLTLSALSRELRECLYRHADPKIVREVWADITARGSTSADKSGPGPSGSGSQSSGGNNTGTV